MEKVEVTKAELIEKIEKQGKIPVGLSKEILKKLSRSELVGVLEVEVNSLVVPGTVKEESIINNKIKLEIAAKGICPGCEYNKEVQLIDRKRVVVEFPVEGIDENCKKKHVNAIKNVSSNLRKHCTLLQKNAGVWKERAKPPRPKTSPILVHGNE